MRQPWIHNAKSDFWWILSPPFIILLIIFLFQNQIETLQSESNFYVWLFLIVFVDVSHVYSTLFKTYFVKKEVQSRKLLYYGLPIFSFVFGVILFQFGSLVFWSVLALIAVFHFVRQQYGFMRLYARFEPNNFHKKIDKIAIYSATIYPMLYWFSSPRNFTWFVENEFQWMGDLPNYLPIITVLYFIVIGIWLLKTVAVYLKFKEFNIPKNAVIVGTFLSWYFGIVYFNNDLIFTLLNVISHGVPYMALVYLKEIKQKSDEDLMWLKIFKNSFGVLLFLIFLFCIAFSEEFLWEILVWKEHINFADIEISSFLLMIIVPLLTMPQLTHYLLDGFIWKRKK